MGAWGPAIFSDDTAQDVRSDYKDYIGDGLESEDATAQLLEDWKETIVDPYERAVFWLALAVTQWKLGRLEDRVKEEALAVIESGCDLARWTGRDRSKREGVLNKTCDMLESPQPAKKKVPKRFRDSCEWKVGEIVAYTTVSKDKILFRVVGFSEDKGGKSPVCELLNWTGVKVPGKMRLRFLGVRKSTFPDGKVRCSKFVLGRTKEKDLPSDRVERLGVVLKPAQDAGGGTVFLWRSLDGHLAEFFGIG